MPETLPFIVSLNPTTTESIFPSPSASRVFLLSALGATASANAVLQIAASGLPDASETLPGTYEYVKGFAVSRLVASDVLNRYVLVETCVTLPPYVAVAPIDHPENEGDARGSENVTSREYAPESSYVEADTALGAAESPREVEALGADALFEESFQADHPAKARTTPPVDVSNPVGSAMTSVAHEAETETDIGEVPIHGRTFESVHAETSVVAERFSEKSVRIRSIFPFPSASRTVADKSLGTALSTEALDTGESELPARSSRVPKGEYVNQGVDAVFSNGENSRTNVCELPVQPFVADGAPTQATVKSAGRRVEQAMGSLIVTSIPSIFPEAARSMVSTSEICGWSVSTVTTGLTTQADTFPRASFAIMRNVTSASMTGTVHSTDPEFAYDVTTTFQIPAPVAYSIDIHETWSTPEIASVIFVGSHWRVLGLAPIQNSPTDGYVQTSLAIMGPLESFTKVDPVEDSLFSLYALSVHFIFNRYDVPSGSQEGIEKPVSDQVAYESEVETSRRFSPTWSNAVHPQYFPSESRFTEARTEDTPLLASEEVPAMDTAPENAEPLETLVERVGARTSATYANAEESRTWPARSVAR